MSCFFQIKNACFVANSNKKIKDFSITIEKKGHIICFLGPSGVGKTTILRSIAGLQDIEEGQIILDKKLINFICKRIARSYDKISEFICTIDEISLKKKKTY